MKNISSNVRKNRERLKPQTRNDLPSVLTFQLDRSVYPKVAVWSLRSLTTRVQWLWVRVQAAATLSPRFSGHQYRDWDVAAKDPAVPSADILEVLLFLLRVCIKHYQPP